MTKAEREALECALRMAKLDGPLESWPASFDIDDESGDDVPSEDRVVGVVRRRGHDGRAAMWTAVASDVPEIRAPLLVAAVNALPALLADSKALELAAVQVEHERARAERLEQALREAADSLANDAKAFHSIGATGFAEQAEADEREARAALGEVKP